MLRDLDIQELAVWSLPQSEYALNELSRNLLRIFKSGFHDKLRPAGALEQDLEDLCADTVKDGVLGVRTGKYDPRRSRLLTWMYVIARAKRAAWMRKYGGKSPLSIDDGDSPVDPLASPKPPELDPPAIEAMMECLKTEGTPDSLTEEERIVINGRANGEIFEQLRKKIGFSMGATFARYKKGLEKLRRCMEKKGYS